MDIIAMARDLARALQQEESVVSYNLARQQSDEDGNLQELIGSFNLKRMDLNAELQKSEKDAEKITTLDKEIKELYASVMENPHMNAYNDAKTRVDHMMSHINNILAAGVNNENPDDVQETDGCSGSCSGCSGCH